MREGNRRREYNCVRAQISQQRERALSSYSESMHSFSLLRLARLCVRGATHPSSNTSPHILLGKHTNEYLLSKFAWFASAETKSKERALVLMQQKGKEGRKN
jgi:hypothetical protein